MFKNYYGYCPEQDLETNVELKYIPVPILGKTEPSYKIKLEYCEYSETYGCSQKYCKLIDYANQSEHSQ